MDKLTENRVLDAKKNDHTTTAFLNLITQTVVRSQNVKNQISQTGVFDLFVYNRPRVRGVYRDTDIPAMEIEPREGFGSNQAFTEFGQKITDEVVPYEIINDAPRGVTTGFLFRIVNCAQQCTLDTKGEATYTNPKVTHEHCLNETSKELYAAEKKYLDNSKTYNKSIFTKFQEDMSSHLKATLAKELANKPVVLRVLINESSDGKKVDEANYVHHYTINKETKLNMSELSQFILNLKNFMGVETHCFYPTIQDVAQGHCGAIQGIVYLESVTANKKECPATTVDFLFLPKGMPRDMVNVYAREKEKPLWTIRA